MHVASMLGMHGTRYPGFQTWAYGKETRLGGRKEICPTFSDCARVVKKNFPEKLSKIVVDGGGRVITKNSY